MAHKQPSQEFEALIRQVVLKTFGQERHTQDSPILPDVWLKFALVGHDARVDLILTPRTGVSPGRSANYLRTVTLPQDSGESTGGNRPKTGLPPAALVAASRNSISAKLTLEETLVVLIPMTAWWVGARQHLPQGSKELKHMEAQDIASLPRTLFAPGCGTCPIGQRAARLGLPSFFRFVAVAGFCLLCQDLNDIAAGADAQAEALRLQELGRRLLLRDATLDDAQVAVDRFAELAQPVALSTTAAQDAGQERALWSVSLNRPAMTAVSTSSRTIKADAARMLFGINAEDITWAVVDCGIDARHPAFLHREPGETVARGQEVDPGRSRVTHTYDFTRLRHLLATGTLDEASRPGPSEAGIGKKPAIQKETLQKLNERIRQGDDLDWELVAPLLEIPHDGSYVQPGDAHGTHVAGIIGGHWGGDENPEGEDMVGMAPDIRLLDIRVFGPGGSDEFTIVSALQFLIHLNRRRDLPVVHGVNLSLSLVHEVKSFACGQTPICQECNRLGSNGLLIVAAAGNRGMDPETGTGNVFESYRDISITDPGNAEGVITVGSTHRSEPHTYGVSYFSSRGPTGDGRRKPDLVAPGEKILGPVPQLGAQPMDGTSMAAPHVSGAAALLMARHRELVGQPRRIKEILCQTATDLGREHYFQGHGLVDILRALQSV